MRSVRGQADEDNKEKVICKLNGKEMSDLGDG